MQLSWRSIRVVIWTLTAIFVLLGGVLFWRISEFVDAGAIAINPPRFATQNRASSAEAVPRVTQAEIDAAGKVDLQRMDKPQPLRPEPAPIVEAVPLAPAIQFQGQLLGTILDSQPEQCFAIIRQPDGSTILIRQGKPLSENEPDLILKQVESDRIAVQRGDDIQIIEQSKL